jgi:hypothetical protein
MLVIVLMAGNGSALVFLAGLFLIPALISLVSLIIKLVFFSTRKYYLLRPFLTVLLFVLIIFIANWSYDMALAEAVTEAGKIQAECNAGSGCPAAPAGWESGSSGIRKRVGSWYDYLMFYTRRDTTFTIHVYQGPDMGHDIHGGVGIPLVTKTYVEQ